MKRVSSKVMKARIRLNGLRNRQKPIRTEKDIEEVQNAMLDTGLYPASMSQCEVVGLYGDCGDNCPIKKNGECEYE